MSTPAGTRIRSRPQAAVFRWTADRKMAGRPFHPSGARRRQQKRSPGNSSSMTSAPGRRSCAGSSSRHTRVPPGTHRFTILPMTFRMIQRGSGAVTALLSAAPGCLPAAARTVPMARIARTLHRTGPLDPCPQDLPILPVRIISWWMATTSSSTGRSFASWQQSTSIPQRAG